MDIVCRKYACRYNDKGKCDRENLKIDNSADCEDVDIDTGKDVSDLSRDMFVREPDVAPYKHCKNINIECLCDGCLFNKSNDCYSNGIVVGANGDKPPCYSYMPK